MIYDLFHAILNDTINDINDIMNDTNDIVNGIMNNINDKRPFPLHEQS